MNILPVPQWISIIFCVLQWVPFKNRGLYVFFYVKKINMETLNTGWVRIRYTSNNEVFMYFFCLFSGNKTMNWSSLEGGYFRHNYHVSFTQRTLQGVVKRGSYHFPVGIPTGKWHPFNHPSGSPLIHVYNFSFYYFTEFSYH